MHHIRIAISIDASKGVRLRVEGVTFKCGRRVHESEFSHHRAILLLGVTESKLCCAADTFPEGTESSIRPLSREIVPDDLHRGEPVQNA